MFEGKKKYQTGRKTYFFINLNNCIVDLRHVYNVLNELKNKILKQQKSHY